MRIAVCVKQVPDTWSEKVLRESDKTLDRDAAEGVLNELDEYAVEEAIRLVEAHTGEGVVISMGPERAAESIRKALSMGADSGVHICDPALHGSDALATSLVLAKALEGRNFDLILFGSESTDARMSVVPAMVAERLGLPQLTFANSVSVQGDEITTTRITSDGVATVKAKLPAVVSVVEKINEPRYPSFKGIMAAKKKTIETLSLNDLGIAASDVGLAASWSLVETVTPRPAKTKGALHTDAGDGGLKIAEFLTTQKII
jgi:electron transfer flavoprotein beta subunit